MGTVYLIGGPPRTGKTTIMREVARRSDAQFVATDAVEHGFRNILTGKPHQMLRHIKLQGTAEHKTSISEGGDMKAFSNEGTESEMMLQIVEGMLDYYERNNDSIALEASDFSPEWVSGLSFENFEIRAAFVGYTDASHADAIITHAKQNPDDWINGWLKQEHGDETKIREWVTRQAEKCKQLQIDAENFGYPFFDVSTMPFEEYKRLTQNHLLNVAFQ